MVISSAHLLGKGNLMDKRVEKLIEWVAEQLYSLVCGHIDTRWSLLDSVYKLHYLKKAKEILNHPDLVCVGCVLCPKCGIIIPKEDARCQLKDKLQKEET